MGSKKTVGIVGGAGYTGGQAIRLIGGHPHIELAWVTSRSQRGKPVGSVHEDLFGSALVFQEDMEDSDAVILCLGHHEAEIFVQQNRDFLVERVIVDLSQDHRDQRDGFIYGLPEWQREKLFGCRRIANPGCFATCLQLGLLPMAAVQALESDIHVTAITGSTGAGASLQPTTHFSWRDQNLSIYKLFAHQHLAEIRQGLQSFQSNLPEIYFVPVRGNHTRGIFASLTMRTGYSPAQALRLYREFYQDHPFVFVSEDPCHLKQVIGTNHCVLHVHVSQGALHITSIIDNLIKGASGQAIQNLNLAFGFDEMDGLRLVPLGL